MTGGHVVAADRTGGRFLRPAALGLTELLVEPAAGVEAAS
jgi:hypothetical protein